MKTKTVFGRKPVSLLLSLCLLLGCGTGYYYVFQANAQQNPILPPLAAQRNLQQWLEHLPDQLMETESLHHLGLVTDIYRSINYRLLWLDNYQLSAAGRSLLRQLQETSADELIDYHYHLSYLQQRLHNLLSRPKDATAIDIMLTDAFVAYAEDVLSEKLLPEKLAQLRKHYHPIRNANLNEPGLNDNPLINAHDQHSIITSLITESPNAHNLNQMMMGLEPKHRAYQQLRKALQRYQTIAADLRWRPLTGTEKLKPGSSQPQVAQLRNLLSLYGDYPVEKNSNLLGWFNKKEDAQEAVDHEFFDSDLEASVKQFQARHGYTPTGTIDKKTRELINVSPAYRVKQIALNMKRWRQLPEHLGDRYIWVNLTNYRLTVIDHDQSIIDMKVIVGKKNRRTPVMHENINSLVLNPQWNVPRQIMVRDILPKVKKDPSYLADRNIRILNGWQEALEVPLDQIDLNAGSLNRFPYRLQQDPGENNALGVVKFVIPNDESIYLHDTNSPGLFAQQYRALSSGCVRVEKPLELAELLLHGKRGWNRQKIDAVLAAGQTTYVKLPESVPTYLLYWTAWVDGRGNIQFRDDIYQEDALLQQTKYDLESLIL